MTAPVIAARTATLVNSNSTYHAINLGSPNAGDLLVVVSAFDGGTISSVSFDEGYSGPLWNRTATVQVTAGGVSARVVWKIAQGGGLDLLRYYTPDNDEQSSHICIRITGHGGAVFIASASGSSTNANPPNVSISGASQDLLFIAAACFDATVTASVAPAGYGNLTSQAGGASGAGVSVADLASLADTADDPGTFTSANEDWVAYTIAVPEGAIATVARQTQEAVEVVNTISPNAIATQLAIEAVSAFANHAVITQVALETVTPQTQDMYITQVALEVLSGDPWPSLTNANKYRQIQIAC
jgi:hypothetical protein